MGADLPALTEVKNEIASRLKITNLGEIKKYIGIEFDIKPMQGTYSIHQTFYLSTILKWFSIQDSKPVHIPMDPNVHLIPTPTDNKLNTSYSYAAVLGSLMYAAVGTQPDIVFAIHHLSQFTSPPFIAHITAVKRVFHYLNGTRTLGLTYQSKDNKALIGYTNADRAATPIDQ